MDLDRLFRKYEWVEEDLAAEVAVNQSTINRIRNEERHASLGLALRIERATKGVVTAEEIHMTDTARSDLKALREANSRARTKAA